MEDLYSEHKCPLDNYRYLLNIKCKWLRKLFYCAWPVLKRQMKKLKKFRFFSCRLYALCWLNSILGSLMVFSFLPKNVHFISKNAISCLFLKNVSPSKRVICFILNNLHFPTVEGIAFYALHKSRVLIILCKADGFRLFMSPGIVIHFRI